MCVGGGGWKSVGGEGRWSGGVTSSNRVCSLVCVFVGGGVGVWMEKCWGGEIEWRCHFFKWGLIFSVCVCWGRGWGIGID